MNQKRVTPVLKNKLQNKFRTPDNNEFWVSFHIYDNNEAAIWWREIFSVCSSRSSTHWCETLTAKPQDVKNRYLHKQIAEWIDRMMEDHDELEDT